MFTTFGSIIPGVRCKACALPFCSSIRMLKITVLPVIRIAFFLLPAVQHLLTFSGILMT
jgi:hypothetical protein